MIMKTHFIKLKWQCFIIIYFISNRFNRSLNKKILFKDNYFDILQIYNHIKFMTKQQQCVRHFVNNKCNHYLFFFKRTDYLYTAIA